MIVCLSRFLAVSATVLGIFSAGLFFAGDCTAETQVKQGQMPKPSNWSAFQEPDFGTIVYYPSNWFQPESPEGQKKYASSEGALSFEQLALEELAGVDAAAVSGIEQLNFYVFTSLNDTARLIVSTHFDPLRTGAEAAASKLREGENAAQFTAVDTGGMWHEERMTLMQAGEAMSLFSRTLYSCKERIVSQVTLIYPTASAADYEPMIAKLKRRFSQGVGAKTPVRECS